MVDFVNNVRSFVNYGIFRELCDPMRFEVDCAKSHHRVISEGLIMSLSVVFIDLYFICQKSSHRFLLIFFSVTEDIVIIEITK